MRTDNKRNSTSIDPLKNTKYSQCMQRRKERVTNILTELYPLLNVRLQLKEVKEMNTWKNKKTQMITFFEESAQSFH